MAEAVTFGKVARKASAAENLTRSVDFRSYWSVITLDRNTHSHGCVRMRNADVVDLFGRVKAGTQVLIEE